MILPTLFSLPTFDFGKYHLLIRNWFCWLIVDVKLMESNEPQRLLLFGGFVSWSVYKVASLICVYIITPILGL